jgi:hypothetical protein
MRSYALYIEYARLPRTKYVHASPNDGGNEIAC